MEKLVLRMIADCPGWLPELEPPHRRDTVCQVLTRLTLDGQVEYCPVKGGYVVPGPKAPLGQASRSRQQSP